MFVEFNLAVFLSNHQSTKFKSPPIFLVLSVYSDVASLLRDWLVTVFLVFRHPPSKYVAVLMITVGIAMATMASANQMVSIVFHRGTVDTLAMCSPQDEAEGRRNEEPSSLNSFTNSDGSIIGFFVLCIGGRHVHVYPCRQ